MVSCCGKYRLMPRLSCCGNWNRACWSAWPGTNNVAQQFATPELLLQSNVTMLLYLTCYVCTEHIPKGCLCSMSRLAVCSNYRREIEGVQPTAVYGLFHWACTSDATLSEPVQESQADQTVTLYVTHHPEERGLGHCLQMAHDNTDLPVPAMQEGQVVMFVPMYDLTV